MPKQGYASRVPARVLRGHVTLGSMQITVGCLVLILNIAIFSTGYTMGTLTGSGFWTAGFFIAAGVSGVAAGRAVCSCSLTYVITCLVLSILASCLGILALILDAVFTSRNYEKSRRSCRMVNGNFNAYLILSIACIVLFAIEFVLATVHASFACRAATCCCLQTASSKAASEEPEPAGSVGQPEPAEGTYPIYFISPDGQLIPLPLGAQQALDPASAGAAAASATASPMVFVDRQQQFVDSGFSMMQPPPYEPRESWKEEEEAVPETKTGF